MTVWLALLLAVGLGSMAVVLLPNHIPITPCAPRAGSVTWTPFPVPEVCSRHVIAETKKLPLGSGSLGEDSHSLVLLQTLERNLPAPQSCPEA